MEAHYDENKHSAYCKFPDDILFLFHKLSTIVVVYIGGQQEQCSEELYADTRALATVDG
jgi:hypothetical protein